MQKETLQEEAEADKVNVEEETLQEQEKVDTEENKNSKLIPGKCLFSLWTEI